MGLAVGGSGPVVLEGFFEPKSVAVVGVAREEGKVGHFVFDNLVTGGFPGTIYPVNPHAEEVHGVPCYPSLRDLPAVPDLAVIVVPASAVPDVIDDCAAAGVSSAIVISAGFKESGREGGALERELVRRAREGGVRLLGPNCLGLISTGACLNASFAAGMPPAGGISFMSQSGALGTAVLDWAAGEGIGLAHFVSLGNRADLSEVDLLEAWRVNSSTRVIVGYLESVADGTGFLRAAAETTAAKPVILVKSGISDAGARAVSSHTGSLAGSEVAYEAAFHAAGVIRAHTVQQLFDYAVAFSLQPLPRGNGVAIVTNAGGPAVMATDACERAGVALASFETATLDALRAALPPAAALYNPVDILGDAPADRYRAALEAVFADPNVRAVLCILTPQATTQAEETAAVLADVARASGKTAIACFMGRDTLEGAIEALHRSGVPQYPFPERAVSALDAMFRYSAALTRPRHLASTVDADRAVVRETIDAARTSGRAFITAEDAAGVLRAYGIQTPDGMLARDLAAARTAAGKIGYPVALKIASREILHKSDIGGLELGIADGDALEAAYQRILTRARAYAPDAPIDGVHVQAMARPGREVIVGIDRDPTFGPLLMFGLGGVYVEVLKDVTFRLCPLDEAEAREMIAEIRGFGLLRGARGQRPADLDALASVIARVSHLAADFPDILELDINPLIVGNTGEGAVAADVRIGIGG